MGGMRNVGWAGPKLKIGGGVNACGAGADERADGKLKSDGTARSCDASALKG